MTKNQGHPRASMLDTTLDGRVEAVRGASRVRGRLANDSPHDVKRSVALLMSALPSEVGRGGVATRAVKGCRLRAYVVNTTELATWYRFGIQSTISRMPAMVSRNEQLRGGVLLVDSGGEKSYGNVPCRRRGGVCAWKRLDVTWPFRLGSGFRASRGVDSRVQRPPHPQSLDPRR